MWADSSISNCLYINNQASYYLEPKRVKPYFSNECIQYNDDN